MLIDFEEIKHRINNSKWYGTTAWYEILDIIGDCEDKSKDALKNPAGVRCGKCAHWNSETNGCKRNPSVEGWKENDFCSYAEVRYMSKWIVEKKDGSYMQDMICPECGRKISCDDDLTNDYKFCPFCGFDTREEGE